MNTGGNMNPRVREHSMFFEKVIEPFIAPFYNIADYLVAKVVVLIGLFSFEISFGLFDTPQQYWETLFYLVILDLFAKNIYIATTKGVDFSLELLIKKTIFKGSSYIIACTVFTLMSNQWEPGSNYVQYVGYMGLCVLEGFSALKHLKLIAFFIALFKQMRTGKIDFKELKHETEEYTKKVDHKNGQ